MRILLLLAIIIAMPGCASRGSLAFATGFMDGRAHAQAPQPAEVGRWTGGQIDGYRAVGQGPAVNCEYAYRGGTFWASFAGYRCPLTTEVR
jgi:hypothetical protein